MMFTRLANLADRRAKVIVIAALIAAIAAGAVGGGVASKLTSFGADDPASESYKATARVAEATGLDTNPGLIALIDTGGRADSRAGRAKVDQVTRLLRSDRDVGRVATAFNGGGADLVAKDGRSTYVAVTFRDGTGEDATKRLRKPLDRIAGVKVGGGQAAELDVNEIVGQDLTRAELMAFPLLFLLSFWVFRSLVASALPLLVGGISILLTMLGLTIAAQGIDISVFALNLVTGLGLGLAIDYSLFIVSRYREELAAHGPGATAMRNTLNTAGRTVLFSSLTVAAALASLLVFPQKFLYSMGIGGVLVSLSAAIVALVVLPAVLALLGHRVNALAPQRFKHATEAHAQGMQSGFWYRLSHFIMRRPGRVAAAAATLMIVLGLPFLRVNFTSVDASVLPPSNEARVVSDVLNRDFPANRTTPVYVVAETSSSTELNRYRVQLERLPDAAAVSPARPLGRGVARIDIVSRGGELANPSKRLVADVRAVDPSFHTLVGGRTAEFVDQRQSIGAHLPIALAIIAVATIVVLFLMTGSVVLPLKAIVMNVLTLSAAFGLLVFIFQDGRLQGVLDYESLGALDLTQPVVLFAVAFGLSTDYGVFLLGRIKEARDRGASDREAVAIGLERTGRIVTAAALLFCVAIGAFATSRVIFIKELGLGTAFAVLLDATIIRALLVPSLMEMLGKWNWWAPRPLRRLHERIGLSEESAQRAPPEPPVPASA
jgi:RND superfamily putative drug exporter